MIQRASYLFALLVSLFYATFASAQETKYSLVESVDVAQSIPSNTIYDIQRDEQGYLWLATPDGLFSYNGNSLRGYANDQGDYLAQSNDVRVVEMDKFGRLWLGTEFDVVVFERDSEKFSSLEGSGSAKAGVRAITPLVGGEEMLVFREDGSLYLYNIEGEKLGQSDPIAGAQINSVAQVDNGRFLLAYQRGIQFIDVDFADLSISYVTPILYNRKEVNDITIDENGRLWLVTAQGGIEYLDDYFTYRGAPTRRAAHLAGFGSVNSMLFDGEQLYLITKEDGVHMLSARDEAYKVLGGKELFKSNLLPFAQNSILAVSGADFSLFNLETGVAESTPFRLNATETYAQKSFCYDSRGELWFAYQGWDSATRLVKIDTLNRVYRIECEKIAQLTRGNGAIGAPLNIAVDFLGDIWIGYKSNLMRATLNETKLGVEKVEQIAENKLFKESDYIPSITKIYPDSIGGVLWAATQMEGMLSFELKEGRSMADLEVNSYRYTAADTTSLGSNSVTSILRASDGTLYVGANMGGVSYSANKKGEKFQFGHINGLSNNSAQSLTEDKEGNLWVATLQGIDVASRLEDGKYKVRPIEQGLQNQRFELGSCVARDGNVAFATANGLCYFRPQELLKKVAIPNIYFGEFKIYNNIIAPNEQVGERVIFTSKLKSGDVVELLHTENHFSITVEMPNRDLNSSYKIGYQLTPLSSEWVVNHEGDNTISFAGVPSGEYTLRVAPFNASGEMGEVIELKIVITPSFWRSTKVYVIYLVVALLLFFVAKSRRRQDNMYYQTLFK